MGYILLIEYVCNIDSALASFIAFTSVAVLYEVYNSTCVILYMGDLPRELQYGIREWFIEYYVEDNKFRTLVDNDWDDSMDGQKLYPL